MIKAIPTIHNGTKYRSRTEARWAVFFERECIPFTYEPEGYQTFAGWYVPDFQLTAAPTMTFFEVKPHEPSRREMEVAAALARGANANVFIALGPPAHRTQIWKILKSGDHQVWFFAMSIDGLTGYLVDSLWLGTQVLKIRDTEYEPDIGGVGPISALQTAGQHQFPMFQDRPARGGERVVVGSRDWRDAARSAEARQFRHTFGREPRRVAKPNERKVRYE